MFTLNEGGKTATAVLPRKVKGGSTARDVIQLSLPPMSYRFALTSAIHACYAKMPKSPDGTFDVSTGDIAELGAMGMAALAMCDPRGLCFDTKLIRSFRDCGRDPVTYGDIAFTVLYEHGYQDQAAVAELAQAVLAWFDASITEFDKAVGQATAGFPKAP